MKKLLLILLLPIMCYAGTPTATAITKVPTGNLTPSGAKDSVVVEAWNYAVNGTDKLICKYGHWVLCVAIDTVNTGDSLQVSLDNGRTYPYMLTDVTGALPIFLTDASGNPVRLGKLSAGVIDTIAVKSNQRIPMKLFVK